MSELSRISQALIERPLAERPPLTRLRARAAKRRRRRLASLSVVVAVSALGAIGLVGSLTGEPEARPAAKLAGYFQAGVSVPDATLEAVGLPASVSVPAKVTPVAVTASSDGALVYVGAGFCPYCALERWALLVALSKFGTFNALSNSVLSSSTDIYPDLASWSFVGAQYSSTYLRFEPTELYSSVPKANGGYQQLQKLNAAQKAAFDQFDPGGQLPFVDIANHYVSLGASASPSVLEGLSLEQVGARLGDPSSPVAQAIDGTANYLIAAICQVSPGARPAVCSSPTTAQALRALGSGVAPTAATSPGQAPAQPPTNAPMSVWQHWSDEMHRFYEDQLAHGATQAMPGCSVAKSWVKGTKLAKPALGIPAGVTVWAIDVIGNCRLRPGGRDK